MEQHANFHVPVSMKSRAEIYEGKAAECEREGDRAAAPALKGKYHGFFAFPRHLYCGSTAPAHANGILDTLDFPLTMQCRLADNSIAGLDQTRGSRKKIVK
jgi:hypothetical protein